MEASFFTRHPVLKDALNIIVFIILVIIGTSFINAFVFRSFNVLGPSMEETLHTGDRLLVNRLPVTWAQLQGKAYVPERGQVIVFENPRYTANTEEQFIVKRVIGLPGERVVLENGQFTAQAHGSECVSGQEIEMFKSHLGTKFDNIDKISANAVQRKRLLRLLMRYYELHVQSFRPPKSLDILYEVFND